MPPADTFSLIAAEAAISSDQLAFGVEALNRSRLNEPASLAQAFFPLTVGLERSAKLVYLLDGYTRTGEFPANKDLREFYHDLGRLLEYLDAEVVKRRWPDDINVTRPSLAVHNRIVDCLTLFASSRGRYYNLDTLSGVSNSDDPIRRWLDDVVGPIYCDKREEGAKIVSNLPASGLEATEVKMISEPYVRQAVLQVIRWIARMVIRLWETQVQGGNLPFLKDYFDRFDKPDRHFVEYRTYRGRS